MGKARKPRRTRPGKAAAWADSPRAVKDMGIALDEALRTGNPLVAAWRRRI